VSSWIPLKPDIPSSRHPIEWLTKSASSTAAGDALDPAAKKAAMVVYAETHSRPDDHDQLPDHGRDDGLQGDPVLLEWVRGVARLNFARAPRDGMSNPSTRRVAQKIRGQSFPSLTKASPAGFLLARPPK
jgi:hypothetical protein